MGEDYIRARPVLSFNFRKLKNRHTILPGLVREPLQQHRQEGRSRQTRQAAMTDGLPSSVDVLPRYRTVAVE